ncbi:MAG: glycosyltransferase family 9 protein [Chloroflexi bacterium]|nr:glycosyltransferase family 9 protein [Chloroflexota bacterium]
MSDSAPALPHQVDPAWAAARNILVMRPDNIGDVVMTGPLLRAVRQALPHSRLTLLASPGGAQAAPLLPWLDQVIPERVLWQDLGHLAFDPGREHALIARLQQGRFDAAIILTSFSQSPYPPAFVARLAGIPLRLGASKEREGGLLTHAPPNPPDESHQVERNLQLIEAVGFLVADRRLSVRIPAEDAASAARRLAAEGMGPDIPFILLCPWASCQARTYFPDRFAVAARELATVTGWPVVVSGAPGDRERSKPILSALEMRGIDLVGRTTVAELAALVASARLVLANDSLPMHLADALETPAVILYSGTELESQWAPRHGPHRLLRRPTSCSPCYAFTCPYNLDCLDFSPAVVVAEALQLLGARAAQDFTTNSVLQY